MLKHILVPLDGSPLSHLALDYATQHLVDTTCIITLLAAVEPPDIPLYSLTPVTALDAEYMDIEVIRQNAQHYLAAVAAQLLQQGFLLTVQVEIGVPAHAIVQVANALDVDLIVMSTHGRSGLNRWLYGSVTSQVLSMAPRPVLVVPSHELHKKFEQEITSSAGTIPV